jgi:hypothetical protein
MKATPQDTMLDRLRRARDARVEHEQAFAETVRAAMADRQGHAVTEIAQAAGITRVRAYQIAQVKR